MACVDMGTTAADKERRGVPLTIKEGEVLWKSMLKRIQANNPERAHELLIEAAKRDPTVLMAAIAQQESQGVKKAIVRNATTEALPILRLLSGLVLSHTSKGIYEQEILGVANLLREHFGPALFVTSENARAALAEHVPSLSPLALYHCRHKSFATALRHPAPLPTPRRPCHLPNSFALVHCHSE